MSLARSSEDRIIKIDQSPQPILRVLITDRDAMSGHLLSEVLGRNRRCDSAVIMASDLLRTLADRPIDLVIISADLYADKGDGFELAHAVHRARPEILIILLLKRTDQESIVTALKCGARGIFSRQSPINDLLDCIDHVKKGYLWAGKEATDTLLQVIKSIPAPAAFSANFSPPLTKRELQVVQYAAQGKTNRAIADELDLSQHTIKNYLFRAFDKLGVSTRTELLFRLTAGGHSWSEGSKGEPRGDGSRALSKSHNPHRLVSGARVPSGSMHTPAVGGTSLIGSA